MITKPISDVSRPIDAVPTSPRGGRALRGSHIAKIEPQAKQKIEVEIARLGDRHRVIAETGADPRQWQLQRRNGAAGWGTVSFCCSRDGLLLAIRDKCVRPEDFARRHDYPTLDPEAMTIIDMLPVRFPRKGGVAR